MIANEKSDNHNVADENCGGCSRMIDCIYNTMDGVTFCGFGFYCKPPTTKGDVFKTEDPKIQIYAGVVIVEPDMGKSFYTKMD